MEIACFLHSHGIDFVLIWLCCYTKNNIIILNSLFPACFLSLFLCFISLLLFPCASVKDSIGVVAVVVVSLSSKTLVYVCLCTFEFCMASMITTSYLGPLEDSLSTVCPSGSIVRVQHPCTSSTFFIAILNGTAAMTLFVLQ